MIEIETTIAAIDAHLRANPTPAVLEEWRALRSHISALDDQRFIYLAIGAALGIVATIAVLAIGSTHP